MAEKTTDGAIADPKFAPITGDITDATETRDIPGELADIRTRVSSLESRELPGEFDASALITRIDELEKAHAAQLEYNRTLEDEIASYRQSAAPVENDGDFVTHILQTYFREDYIRYAAMRADEKPTE